MNVITKFEDFYNNFNYIFDCLNDIFSVKIMIEKRKSLQEKYSIENVMKKVSKLNNFSETDEHNMFHGQHISEYKGQPGKWTQYVPLELHSYFTNSVMIYLKKWKYID